ncbi:MAG: DUF1028 domain-containing protein [Alphaproteobacteria bacterium]|nr:DUF1028 domain-containing protein [Alphaproteobacteria bacterium]
MTFTCIARDAATGELGIATATRSLAVGVRVPHVSRLGAVAIMAIADYRLGRLAQDLLANGCPAEAVIDGLVATDPYPEYRQLGIIDAEGRAAARTGRENRDFAGHHVRDGLIALGNVLVGEHVLDAIEAGFQGGSLAERLLAALEAGRDAGGQHGGQNSAALVAWGGHGFPLVDLRVDIHEEPVGELRRVFDAWKPAGDYYTERQLDPRVRPLHETLPGRGY